MNKNSNADELLEKPIIFIGPGRSGSTIISEFIMTHEQLAWPTNYLEFHPGADWTNYLRPLFDNKYWRITAEKDQLNKTRFLNSWFPYPSEAYPFWERLTREEINFSRHFLLGMVATPEEKNRIRTVFKKLVSAQKRKRLALKVTGPGRVGYLQSIFPDAIFINIVRDVDATVRSLLKVPFWQTQGLKQLWWLGGYSEEELNHYEKIKHDPVLSTRLQVEKILMTTITEAQESCANIITIPYESFIESPEKTVKQIMDYCELPKSKWIDLKLQNTSIHDRNLIREKKDAHN